VVAARRSGQQLPEGGREWGRAATAAELLPGGTGLRVWAMSMVRGGRDTGAAELTYRSRRLLLLLLLLPPPPVCSFALLALHLLLSLRLHCSSSGPCLTLLPLAFSLCLSQQRLGRRAAAAAAAAGTAVAFRRQSGRVRMFGRERVVGSSNERYWCWGWWRRRR
jgi:hypothetical protein